MTKPRRPSPPQPPRLRFTPTAWAKWLWLRDRGPTEIGGFGISSRDDLLRVTDVVLIPQLTSLATVVLDDLALADYFEQQVDLGRSPVEFARIWLHTHPGDCPWPSAVDEATFANVFCPCDWAVMGIVARSGASYARLAWHTGPVGAIELPIDIDFTPPFAATEEAAWAAEYDRCVQCEPGCGPPDLWGAGGLADEWAVGLGDDLFLERDVRMHGENHDTDRPLLAPGGAGAAGPALPTHDHRDRRGGHRPSGGPATRRDRSPAVGTDRPG